VELFLPERSGGKKAGTEGGKSCHKKMKAESYYLPAS